MAVKESELKRLKAELEAIDSVIKQGRHCSKDCQP